MNKIRLILKYQSIKENQEKKRLPSIVDVNDVLEDLSNFDPFVDYVPEVPEYVKEWYHSVQSDFYPSLEMLVQNASRNQHMPICEWYIKTPYALRILINIHQFGYTVKKEKKYKVKIKGLSSNEDCLYFGLNSHSWKLKSETTEGEFRRSHTKKELQDGGFGEVFNSSLFEVEEVKDETK